MKNYKLCNGIVVGRSDKDKKNKCCTKKIQWFDKEIETFFTLDAKDNESIDKAVEFFNEVFSKREFI